MQRNIEINTSFVLCYVEKSTAEKKFFLEKAFIFYNSVECVCKKIKEIKNNKTFLCWYGHSEKYVKDFLNLEEKRRKCKEILK